MTPTSRSPDRAAREAVARALVTLRPRLAAYVRARLGPEFGLDLDAEVDDVLQVAALRAVRRAGSLADPERVAGWLFQLHRRVLVDRARERRSRRELARRLRFWKERVEPAPEPVASPADDDRCGCSLAQARALPASLADVLLRVDVEGATVAEAAAAIGITSNAARVRLHRARKALRARLLAHCGVTSAGDCRECRCAYEGCCA